VENRASRCAVLAHCNNIFSGQSFKRGREELEAVNGSAVLGLLQRGMVYVSLLEARNSMATLIRNKLPLALE